MITMSNNLCNDSHLFSGTKSRGEDGPHCLRRTSTGERGFTTSTVSKKRKVFAVIVVLGIEDCCGFLIEPRSYFSTNPKAWIKLWFALHHKSKECAEAVIIRTP